MIRAFLLVMMFFGLGLMAAAAPTPKAIEAAMNLEPGKSISLNMFGTPITVTYIGIEPRKGREYNIVVKIN